MMCLTHFKRSKTTCFTIEHNTNSLQMSYPEQSSLVTDFRKIRNMDKETKELLKRTLSMTDDKLLLKILAVQETVNATDRLQMGCTTLVSRVRKANCRRACLPDGCSSPL